MEDQRRRGWKDTGVRIGGRKRRKGNERGRGVTGEMFPLGGGRGKNERKEVKA